MIKPKKQAKQSAVRSTSIFYHPLSKTSILDSDLELDYLLFKIFPAGIGIFKDPARADFFKC